MAEQCEYLVLFDGHGQVVDGLEVAKLHRHSLQLDWVFRSNFLGANASQTSFAVVNSRTDSSQFSVALSSLRLAFPAAEARVLGDTVAVRLDSLHVQMQEEVERNVQDEEYP